MGSTAPSATGCYMKLHPAALRGGGCAAQPGLGHAGERLRHLQPAHPRRRRGLPLFEEGLPLLPRRLTNSCKAGPMRLLAWGWALVRAGKNATASPRPPKALRLHGSLRSRSGSGPTQKKQASAAMPAAITPRKTSRPRDQKTRVRRGDFLEGRDR